MYSAIRPYVTTGIALVGASVVAVAPITVPPPPAPPISVATETIVDGSNVQLTALFDSLVDAAGFSAKNVAGVYLVLLPSILQHVVDSGRYAELLALPYDIPVNTLTSALLPFAAALAHELPLPLGTDAGVVNNAYYALASLLKIGSEALAGLVAVVAGDPDADEALLKINAAVGYFVESVQGVVTALAGYLGITETAQPQGKQAVGSQSFGTPGGGIAELIHQVRFGLRGIAEIPEDFLIAATGAEIDITNPGDVSTADVVVSALGRAITESLLLPTNPLHFAENILSGYSPEDALASAIGDEVAYAPYFAALLALGLNNDLPAPIGGDPDVNDDIDETLLISVAKRFSDLYIELASIFPPESLAVQEAKSIGSQRIGAPDTDIINDVLTNLFVTVPQYLDYFGAEVGDIASGAVPLRQGLDQALVYLSNGIRLVTEAPGLLLIGVTGAEYQDGNNVGVADALVITAAQGLSQVLGLPKLPVNVALDLVNGKLSMPSARSALAEAVTFPLAAASTFAIGLNHDLPSPFGGDTDITNLPDEGLAWPVARRIGELSGGIYQAIVSSPGMRQGKLGSGTEQLTIESNPESPGAVNQTTLDITKTVSLPITPKKEKEKTGTAIEKLNGADDLRDGNAATPGGKTGSKADRPARKVVNQLRDGVRTVVKDIGDNVRKLTGHGKGTEKQNDTDAAASGAQDGTPKT